MLEEIMAAMGVRPMGVTEDGRYTAVIEVAQDPEGSFDWTNLNVAAAKPVGRGVKRPAPFPSLTSGIAAIEWGAESRRIYYADTDGAVIELETDGARWGYSNFTSAIGAPVAAWSSPLAADGRRSEKLGVYYVAEGGGLTILRYDNGWKLGTNLKIPPVAPTSPLTAMQNDRGRFVYYFTDDNHVREVEVTGTESRQTSDLTKFAALRPASPLSGLTAVGWGKDSRRVYYADTGDNLIEMAGFGDQSDKWVWRDLTEQGARNLRDGSPLAAATADGSFPSVAQWCRQRMPFLMWWDDRGGWSVNEIYTTQKGTCPLVAANSSAACAVAPDGLPWVSFVTEDNHLALWRGLERDWLWWDLTDELGLPRVADVATQGPLVLAYTESGPRIYYLTDDPEF
ncbi:hypothetical protein ACWGK1_33635 [Streptomyces wedmorensis]